MTIRKTYDWLMETYAGSQRGIRDVVLLMIPQVVLVLAAFATSVLIARGLGPSGLGKYALILSVSGVAASLSDLGIGQTAIRFASRAASVQDTDAQMAVLRWAFRLRIVFSLVVTALFILFAQTLAEGLWHSPDLTPLMQIGLLGGIFTALASVPAIYFQSLKRFDKNAIINVGQTLISLLGIGILAALQIWSVRAVVIVSVIASAVGALAFLLAVPRLALVGRGSVPSSVHEVFRKIWRNPLSSHPAHPVQASDTPTTFARYNLASTVIVLLILRMDVWLMGVFLDQSQIGIYNAATRFTAPLAIVLTAIGGALWPRASSQQTVEQVVLLMRKTFQLSVALGIVAAVYAMLFPYFAPLLFGRDFAESRLLAQILCFRYAIAIMIAPVGVIGYSLGMVRVYWIINLTQLCAVVLLNMIFLPTLGPLASALALLANEVLGFTLAGAVLWKRIHRAQGILYATPSE